MAFQCVAVGPPAHRVDEPDIGVGPAGPLQVGPRPGAEPQAVDGAGAAGDGQQRPGDVGFLEVERELEVRPTLA